MFGKLNELQFALLMMCHSQWSKPYFSFTQYKFMSDLFVHKFCCSIYQYSRHSIRILKNKNICFQFVHSSFCKLRLSKRFAIIFTYMCLIWKHWLTCTFPSFVNVTLTELQWLQQICRKSAANKFACRKKEYIFLWTLKIFSAYLLQTFVCRKTTENHSSISNNTKCFQVVCKNFQIILKCLQETYGNLQL